MWRILMEATSDPGFRNTICVFDALDECRDQDQKLLIERLAQRLGYGVLMFSRSPLLSFVILGVHFFLFFCFSFPLLYTQRQNWCRDLTLFDCFSIPALSGANLY